MPAAIRSEPIFSTAPPRRHEGMNRLFLAPTSLGGPPPLEYIQAVASAGYDGLGLRLYRSPGRTYAFHPVAGNRSLIRDIQRALDDSGLELLDIFSFYLDAAVEFDAMRAAMETGAELGAQYAFVIGADPDWRRLGDTFARVCEDAADLGLKVAVEAPVVDQELKTLPLALQLIGESGRGTIAVCLDPEQFIRAGHTASDLASVDPTLLAYAQINDRTQAGGRCGPGQGEVPLASILDALPPDVDLSVEWSAAGPGPASADDWARLTLETTRTFLTGYHDARQARR